MDDRRAWRAPHRKERDATVPELCEVFGNGPCSGRAIDHYGVDLGATRDIEDREREASAPCRFHCRDVSYRADDEAVDQGFAQRHVELRLAAVDEGEAMAHGVAGLRDAGDELAAIGAEDHVGDAEGAGDNEAEGV